MYKTRAARREVGHGRWKFYNDPIVDKPGRTLTERGELYTWNHDVRNLGRGDIGGPFWSSQSRFETEDVFHKVHGLGRWYEGTLHTHAYTELVAGYPAKPENFDSVVSAGATAISRTIPTNPVSGAAVTIGEARQGAPRIVGDLYRQRILEFRKLQGKPSRYRPGQASRDAGSEYLNVEFGWKPLVRDLLSFGRAVKDSNKVMRQMYRDSGTNNAVRRRYNFPVVEDLGNPDPTPKWSWVAPFMCDGGTLDAWMLGSGPNQVGFRQWTTKATKLWFSGAYSYVMPPPPNGNSTFGEKLDHWDAEANKLFGTRLTPEVVWNLAPWSWAADWFGNTGDVLANISALGADSLVLKYGYIMRQERVMDHTSWEGYINTQPDGHGARFIRIREAYGYETKLRLRATPYGFGIDMGGFSPRQIAISAAVGVNRMPRVSW